MKKQYYYFKDHNRLVIFKIEEDPIDSDEKSIWGTIATKHYYTDDNYDIYGRILTSPKIKKEYVKANDFYILSGKYAIYSDYPETLPPKFTDKIINRFLDLMENPEKIRRYKKWSNGIDGITFLYAGSDAL